MSDKEMSDRLEMAQAIRERLRYLRYLYNEFEEITSNDDEGMTIVTISKEELLMIIEKLQFRLDKKEEQE